MASLQERLEKVDREIATWQERERAAHEQTVARQGQRALLVELLEEQPEPAAGAANVAGITGTVTS